jgi:ubiquinone/menaquinone biosynthesis C-methylase UbiE
MEAARADWRKKAVTEDNREIAQFYDEFVSSQERAAFNERHAFLRNLLVALGLRDDSNVLELGCGIGVITALVARLNTRGRILAVDLSPASIEKAHQRLSWARNVELATADVVDYRSPANLEFDYVTLFDVLEHIPVARHRQLFDGITRSMREGTQLVVNIPTHDYLQYLHEHEPTTLQVVDQPLRVEEVLAATASVGLELTFFARYGVWLKDEYQVLVFRSASPFRRMPIKQLPRSRRGLDRLLRAIQKRIPGNSLLWWLGVN